MNTSIKTSDNTAGDWTVTTATWPANYSCLMVCSPWTNISVIANPQPEKEKKKVNIYICFLVDAVENSILVGPLYLIGKDEKSASAGLNLTPDQIKGLAKGDLAIVTEEIGSYEPVEISYVRNH